MWVLISSQALSSLPRRMAWTTASCWRWMAITPPGSLYKASKTACVCSWSRFMISCAIWLNRALWVALAMARWKETSMWAVVTSPGLTTESARRLMSSREARWAANPDASISTEARSCINSRTCSAPLPRSWARDVPILDRGDVATRVPCGPRPDTRTPWVLSSCRASRMAGLPTPNCSARARSEGIRSPGLTVPVETISLMREATLPGKVASRIREMVSTGTVKPGERIPSERALAEQLGVGRPAIREALQELKTQGVLVSGRGPQGTRVATSPLSRIGTSLAQLLGSGAEHVRELMQLRASVEIEAAGLAAHRASLEDIRRLADSVVKPGEVTTAHIDVSFHLAIARATHNALFLS